MLMLVIVIILCFYIYPESTSSSDCRFKNNNMRHVLYDRDTSLTCVFFSCASWSISWAVGFKSYLVWHQEFKMERYIWSISCFLLVLREMLLISKKTLYSFSCLLPWDYFVYDGLIFMFHEFYLECCSY